MVEPSRSAGSRSGVNCTRVKSSPSAAANDRAISVLPRPGRSSISTWPRASTVVRINVSAARFPTTTRSISSSTAIARVAVATTVSEVISDAYPLSYLLKPFQDFFQSPPPRAGFAHAGARDVVGVYPSPQLGAEKCSAGCVERSRILCLLLAGGDRESSGQHRAQMPVPVGSRRFRPANQRLGSGQPAAQRLLEGIRDLRRRRLDVAAQDSPHVDQREKHCSTGSPEHKMTIVQRQRGHLRAQYNRNAK